MKPKTDMSAAVVTIYGPGKMTKKGRSQIAQWLRRTADDLQSLGDQYTESRFTARYIVPLTKLGFLTLPMRQRRNILKASCTPEMVKHYTKS